MKNIVHSSYGMLLQYDTDTNTAEQIKSTDLYPAGTFIANCDGQITDNDVVTQYKTGDIILTISRNTDGFHTIVIPKDNDTAQQLFKLLDALASERNSELAQPKVGE